MDFIKYLDIFSIKFHFYTNNQANYQNVFGGIMSLIFIIICIVIFITLSYDDLYRLNPITTISEIPDSGSKIINKKDQKIWIPFRITNEENIFIDHRKMLEIIPYLIEGNYKENAGMDLKYHILNYKLCNETSMANKPYNYKIDVPLNELFCIEEDDISFGGNKNNKFLNYVQINLFLCDEGIYFNSSDSRCSKIMDFFKDFNSSLLFDFYYPIVQFQPRDLDTPIAIIYRNYLYRLSSYSLKLEKLYLQEHILSDNKNMIKNNYRNSSYWGISNLYGENYSIRNEIDPIVRDKPKKIYSMEIYADSGLVYYTRTYKNLFFIVSNSIPLFRLVLYVLKKITQHVKISLTKRKLTGIFFEDNEIKQNECRLNKVRSFNKDLNVQNYKKTIELNKKGNELLKKENMNIMNSQNNIIDLNNKSDINVICFKNEKNKNNNEINIEINNSKINKSNQSLSNENMIKALNKNQILLIKKKSKDKSFFQPINIYDSPKNNAKVKKHKESTFLFPYFYFLLDFIFDQLVHPQKFFCMPKIYFTVYNFMCQIYDISTHVIFYKKFNLLNKLILKKFYEDEIFATKTFNKINLNDKLKMEKINKDLKNKKLIVFSNYLF